MNDIRNDATRNRPGGERIIDAESLLIDLPAFIKQVKTEDAWQKNDRNSITVFKTDDMSIVLGALHKDAEMKHIKSEGITVIQLLDGLLEVNTDKLTGILQSGRMIAIHKGCNYRFLALEESVFLLTISGAKQ